jgi:integrase
MKATLSAIYQEGRENDKVRVNPARDLKQRPVSNGVIRFLTLDEETRLRGVLRGHIQIKGHLAQYQEPQIRHRLAELDVALGTGMRKSEQYGLKWRDIDFTERIINLRDTKNGSSRRVFMIDDVVTAMHTLKALGLKRRVARAGDVAPEDMVFALGDNKKWWNAALKEAGIENFRWHDLRHTFCSRLAQNGASLKIIQEAAGHKTIAMSARYAHLDTSTIANALAVLNRPKSAV